MAILLEPGSLEKGEITKKKKNTSPGKSFEGEGKTSRKKKQVGAAKLRWKEGGLANLLVGKD